MKLFSEKFCDEVIIRNDFYKEFYELVKNSQYYEEEKVNDLIYFAYDSFDSLATRSNKIGKTKRKLLYQTVDIINEISVGNLINLKTFQLEKLLLEEKGYYRQAYFEIIGEIYTDTEE